MTSYTNEVSNVFQCFTEFFAISCGACFFQRCFIKIYGIVCLCSELVRFFTIFSYISFTEVFNLLVFFIREPRCTNDNAVSRIASNFNELWAVEAVRANYRLIHTHFTHFFHDKGTFLVKGCNDNYIWFSLLNLSQLSREVSIFICKCFSINDLYAYRFQCFTSCIVYRYHLVIVVRIHNSCCFKAQCFMSFFNSCIYCQGFWYSITENIIPNICNTFSSCRCTKRYYFAFICYRTSCHHFTR